MTELVLTFMGGLLGSSHCLGMCGGFAVSIGSAAPSLAANLRRQCVYSLGRIGTYSLIGAIAGFCGWQLARTSSSLVPMQAILAIVAGLLLVVQGLFSAGIVRRRVRAMHQPCLAQALGSLFRGTDLRNAFIAGVATGFLPCGLVYAFLALAGSSGTLWSGMLHMALFGLGTVPLMVLAGTGGTLLQLAARRNILRMAGWCVILAGTLSIYRGIMFLPWLPGSSDASCPCCR